MNRLLKGLFFGMALLTSHQLFAQATVSGTVTDRQRKSIGAAPVALLAVKDSTTQYAVLANDNGQYTFTAVKNGGYILSIQAVGYKKYYRRIQVTQPGVNLAVAELETSTNELAAVTVNSTKSFTEQKIDRTVVNVDALISNTGSNALEVLEKTPGVMVDENGAISLKGKSGILVLIDDKPTYLSAADLATYLRSLPSSQLDKIELMDNPPAKYDAAGNGGVINIKTKKIKTKGFNGSFSSTYGQSYYPRFFQSLNLNYASGKINLFANLGYNVQRNARLLAVTRDYFDASGNPASALKQDNYFSSLNKTPNGKIGFDYAASPKTTWGMVYTGSFTNGTETRPTFSQLYNNTNVLDSSIQADNRTWGHWRKNGVNFNFTHKYDSTGKTFGFDMDYINYRSNGEQSFSNGTYTSSGTLKYTQNILSVTPSNISIYAAKADFSKPLPGDGKLEAGIKTSYVVSDNQANYYNVSGGVGTPDYNNTNHFIYKENINAAYLSFNKAFSRLSVQAGLRLENTNGNGHQLGNLYRADSMFTKHYTNVFPTAYLSYKLDSAGDNLLNFAYGRRIDRPNYQSLNPFVFLLDKFSVFAGNPFLRPQYANDFKLSYSYKNKLTLSAQYVHINDIQIETIEQSGQVFISRNGNIGQWNYVVVSVESTLKPTSWWTANLYLDLFNYQAYSGQVYSRDLYTSTVYTYLNGNNQFTLGKGWSAELGGFFCSPRVTAQFDKIAFGQLNAGLQKKFWNNKASLKLSARDLFNTNVSAGNITNVPNAKITFRNNFYNPVWLLGFTYSFGTQQQKEKRKTGSADTEAGRAGN